MIRTATLLALTSMLIVGIAGGAAAQAPTPLPSSAGATYAGQHDGSAGMPPVTYDEIVGSPRGAAGYNVGASAVGAVAGVMVINMLLPVFGYSAVPAVLAGTAITGATLEAALATSRLITVGGAAAGAVIGQWAYAGWGR